MSSNSLLKSVIAIVLVLVLLTGCAPHTTATPDINQSLTGIWTSNVSKEDILRVVPEFDQQYLCDNTGTFVWEFKEDGSYIVNQTSGVSDCPAPSHTQFEDSWSIEGNLITLAPGTPDQEIYEISIEKDKLTLNLKSSQCIPCVAVNTANPWTRVK